MGTGSTPTEEASIPELPAEEAWRARTYGLLARLLAEPPGAETLAGLGGLQEADAEEGTAMLEAWRALGRAGAAADAGAVDDEFHDLFIGLGRGELVPFASWYLTGLLMDKPLVLLRQELKALGFERRADNRDPEDHAAALCEVMGQLAAQGDPLERQRRLFEEHVAPWMPRFFQDLQEAESADFYRAVGGVGARFLELEHRYLTMPE
jgi:TorA maturation chaperone TorD